LTQGNIFQGELSLEQLFFLRPVPGWAYYRTPIDNLYMCGSATHPGGGIMGAPGRIASQVILKEWKKSASASRSDRSKPMSSNGSQLQAPAASAPAVATTSHKAEVQKAGDEIHIDPPHRESSPEETLPDDTSADSTVPPDSEKN
jgi:hypothetical protein